MTETIAVPPVIKHEFIRVRIFAVLSALLIPTAC